MQDTVHLRVPTDKLSEVRETARTVRPNATIRRFIIDCHDGKEYRNIEFDHIDCVDEKKSDEEILNCIRRKLFENGGNKIYSCFELTCDLTIEQLRQPMTKEMESTLLNGGMKMLFLDLSFEPLEAYCYML